MSGERTVYNIGTRKSKLAMVQTHDVMNQLQQIFPSYTFKVFEQETLGDKVLDVALSKIGDKGLFTQELEEGLLNGSVHFAVHSLKDLPTRLPEGLIIGCILERVNPRDVLLMRSDLAEKGLKTLSDLNASSEENWTIGTSSLRRQSQLQHNYPNLKCTDIRGNLDTRIKKLENQNNEFSQHYAAIILAWAGLERQGSSYTSRVTQMIDEDEMYHAVGQGALAVECRADDHETIAMLSKLHHVPTANACLAERAFLRTLEGGCHAPIGVNTKILPNGNLLLKGRVLSLDGKESVQDQIEGSMADAEALGNELAQRVLKLGADKILEQISKK